jgi:hypothetical protein
MANGPVNTVQGQHRAFQAAVVSCVLALLWAGPVAAQTERDRSLTDAFQGMSAKERSKIAAKEVEEAASDQAYQQVMNEAEAHFQAGRYPDALASFKQARSLRPFNVYPKVKIQDLEALLAQAGAAPPPGNEVLAPASPLDAPAQVPPGRPDTATPTQAPVVPVHAPVRQDQGTGSAGSSAPVRAAPPADPAWLVDGAEERRYKEGNAFVIERRLMQEGAPVVYKRVQHPWGQVYYFKDGEPIDPRVWKERFAEP